MRIEEKKLHTSLASNYFECICAYVSVCRLFFSCFCTVQTTREKNLIIPLNLAEKRIKTNIKCVKFYVTKKTTKSSSVIHIFWVEKSAFSGQKILWYGQQTIQITMKYLWDIVRQTCMNSIPFSVGGQCLAFIGYFYHQMMIKLNIEFHV